MLDGGMPLVYEDISKAMKPCKIRQTAERTTVMNNQQSIQIEIGMPVTVYYVGMAVVYYVTDVSKNGNVITVENRGVTKRFRRPKDGRTYWTGVARDNGLLAEVGVENPQELWD